MVDFTTPSKNQWDQYVDDDEGSGHKNPATGENDVPSTPAITFSWSNPGNIVTEAGGEAGLSTSGGAPYVLPYLRASDFGFDIPTGATIVGIEAEIRWGFSNSGDYTEDEVKLAWGASASTLSIGNQGSAGAIGDNAYRSYGGAADLWGESTATLTPTVLNTSDFGFVIKIGRAGGSFGRSANIDIMRLRVTYSQASGSGNARVTQVYSEAIISQKADALVTQVYAETIMSKKEDALVSQVYAEVLHNRNFVSNVPEGRRQTIVVTAT